MNAKCGTFIHSITIILLAAVKMRTDFRPVSMRAVLLMASVLTAVALITGAVFNVIEDRNSWLIHAHPCMLVSSKQVFLGLYPALSLYLAGVTFMCLT